MEARKTEEGKTGVGEMGIPHPIIPYLVYLPS